MRKTVSLQQAAQVLRVSRRTVYSRIAEGRLQTLRVGASQRVVLASVEAERWKKHQRVLRQPLTYPYPYDEDA